MEPHFGAPFSIQARDLRRMWNALGNRRLPADGSFPAN